MPLQCYVAIRCVVRELNSAFPNLPSDPLFSITANTRKEIILSLDTIYQAAVAINVARFRKEYQFQRLMNQLT